MRACHRNAAPGNTQQPTPNPHTVSVTAQPPAVDALGGLVPRLAPVPRAMRHAAFSSLASPCVELLLQPTRAAGFFDVTAQGFGPQAAHDMLVSAAGRGGWWRHGVGMVIQNKCFAQTMAHFRRAVALLSSLAATVRRKPATMKTVVFSSIKVRCLFACVSATHSHVDLFPARSPAFTIQAACALSSAASHCSLH